MAEQSQPDKAIEFSETWDVAVLPDNTQDLRELGLLSTSTGDEEEWQEVSYQNSSYWYNTITGDSRWDRPSRTSLGDITSDDSIMPASISPEITITTSSSSISAVSGELGLIPSSTHAWKYVTYQNSSYWFNSTTGESRWDKPSEVSSDLSSSQTLSEQTTDTASGQLALVPSTTSQWLEVTSDDSSSSSYWYNSTTGESRWDKPLELLGAPGDGSSIIMTSTMTTTTTPTTTTSPSGQILAVSSSSLGWEMVTYEGSSYWYNSITGESQWDKPEEVPNEGASELSLVVPQSVAQSGWEVVPYGDTSYWYNNITGESQWDQPEPDQSLVAPSKIVDGAWQQVEEGGTPYWLNTTTGDRSYEIPRATPPKGNTPPTAPTNERRQSSSSSGKPIRIPTGVVVVEKLAIRLRDNNCRHVSARPETVIRIHVFAGPCDGSNGGNEAQVHPRRGSPCCYHLCRYVLFNR